LNPGVIVPSTARIHFDEDIKRSQEMLNHAKSLEDSNKTKQLCQDIRIAAIALAVGAMDAYLCDKYVDCLASVLREYAKGSWQGDLPSFYKKVRLPAGDVLDASRQSRPAWGIRMAARNIMEKDNLLTISRIDEMFNPILPSGKKLWADFIGQMLALDYRRLTGSKTLAEITDLTGKDKEQATKKAIHTLKDRIGGIIQIRHDWIHNCSRPKTAIVQYTHGEAKARVRDIRLFIKTFDDHLEKYRRT